MQITVWVILDNSSNKFLKELTNLGRWHSNTNKWQSIYKSFLDMEYFKKILTFANERSPNQSIPKNKLEISKDSVFNLTIWIFDQ